MLSREGLRAPPGPEGEKARLAAVVSGDHAAALLVPRRKRRGHMAGRHIAPIYVEGPLRLDRIRRVEVADGQRSRVGMLRRQVVETAARAAGLDALAVLQTDAEGHIPAFHPAALRARACPETAGGIEEQNEGDRKSQYGSAYRREHVLPHVPLLALHVLLPALASVAEGIRLDSGPLARGVVPPPECSCTQARRALSTHGIPSLEGVHLAPGPRVVPMTSSMTSSWSPIP